jgi:two-component system sensor histidine kinase PilS (NtrC family)
MRADSGEHSWFGASVFEPSPPQRNDQQEFKRLWQAFMTARWVLGAALFGLQIVLFFGNPAQDLLLLTITAIYFAGTLGTRLLLKPRPLGGAFNKTWGVLIGIDVVVFSALQWLQGSSVNYTPLFALPVLLASTLGSLRLALGTAAGVTVLMLGGATWAQIHGGSDNTAMFAQGGLSGIGFFAVAFLANQLATRLANEGQRARQNQLAASIQREVNELVIDAMPEGVLIVDQKGIVRAANPAARMLLGDEDRLRPALFDLKVEPAWRPLLQLVRLSLGSGQPQEAEVELQSEQSGPLRVLARTRLAAPQGIGADSLCVLFLQDQRHLEAKLRTEKLASMGRMSTAVAHEIRNPLAAIAQANALLSEELEDPRQLRLTQMVGQNAKRLGKIVDDILNVARARSASASDQETLYGLSDTVHRITQEWAQHKAVVGLIGIDIDPRPHAVRFDAEHLRQVLINLLDNALRYASKQVEAVQVSTSYTETTATVSVWSDGARMDQTVERHLFEPFFSSESRSSGLGLYISRELCERHGARLHFERTVRPRGGQPCEGNDFILSMALMTNTLNPEAYGNSQWQAPLY